MDLRYPIGPFEWKGESSEEQRRVRIDRIEAAPVRLMAAVQGLSEEQFDTPYRPGGWTLRQVVHHLADSHLNSYTRFRLALTEDAPVINRRGHRSWGNRSFLCQCLLSSPKSVCGSVSGRRLKLPSGT